MHARSQERELLIRVCFSDRNMNKQLTLRVDSETDKQIDFEHRKCEFATTVKVRAVNCCLTRACTVLTVCVFNDK